MSSKLTADLPKSSLRVVPCSLAAANAFVAQHHRTHKPARGAKFVAAVAVGDQLVGVAVVGRPVARRLDDGATLEITRCCTDGTRNACSKLYGIARRVAGILGYRLVVTYTMHGEPGASLRAAGYCLAGDTRGGSWHRSARRRVDQAPTVVKQRWEARP